MLLTQNKLQNIINFIESDNSIIDNTSIINEEDLLYITQNNEDKTIIIKDLFNSSLLDNIIKSKLNNQELNNQIIDKLNTIDKLVDNLSVNIKNNIKDNIKDNNDLKNNIDKTDNNKIGSIFTNDNKLTYPLLKNTRYFIGNDIIDTNVTLPQGSKIIPNGGIPLNQIKGGEVSWIHSSDIGMMQDDGTHDISIGKYNKKIFELVVQSPYNLILDGDYYIHISDTKVDSTLGIQINRDFSIQNGKLFLRDNFITINKNASFTAQNVIFEAIDDAWGYPLFYFKPADGLINNIEFVNCKFLSNKSKRFFQTVANDICPSDINAYKKYNINSLNEFNNALSIDDGTGHFYVYKFPSKYKLNSKGELIDNNNKVIDKSKYNSIAIEKHQINNDYFIIDKNGEFIFVKDKSGKDITNGNIGYFININEATDTEKNNTDGNRYNNVIDNTILQTDYYGIDNFRLINCVGKHVYFNIGDVMYKTSFEVINCKFENITTSCFNIGSSNNRPYVNIWLQKSCQFVFKNTEFKGLNSVIKKTGDNYTCGILAEGNSICITNCRFINMVSNRYATYECYLSVGEIIFENNFIYNVFSVPRDASKETPARSKFLTPLSEWMKSKGAPVINGRTPLRMYRNNWFEIDYDTAWIMCKDYLINMYPEEDPKYIFDTYCMKQHIFGFVTKAPIKLVIDNNTYKFPYGVLKQNLQSSRAGSYKEIIITNNNFIFGKFDTNFNTPIVAIRNSVEDYPLNINISYNKFESVKEPSNIQLFSIDTNVKLNNVYIQHNIFNNSNFRISNYSNGVGRPILYAQNYFINNNTFNLGNSGVPNILSHISTISSNNNLCGDLFRCKAIEYFDIELYDKQAYNKTAETEKIIEINSTVGNMKINIPYMNRILKLNDNGFTDKDLNKTLVLYWSNIENNITYSIDITYTYKGKTYTKHMEYAHTSESKYQTSVFRDVQGKLTGIYSFKGFTFNNLSPINDIGLGMFAEGFNSSGTTGDFALHLYTINQSGSLNDFGTNIIINIKKIQESGIFSANKNPILTNLTPMKFFVPTNSLVTQDWLDYTQNGFEYQGTTTRKGKIMTNEDIGMIVNVNNNYYKWNGSSWILI